MHDLLVSAHALDDDDLLASTRSLIGRERRLTAELVAHLAEIDARGLALKAGHSSLFAYCRAVLGLSEYEAYGRIEAARAARRFPLILDLLRDNALTMTAASLLARHLTTENHEQVLRSACGKTKLQVEEIVASLAPRPAAPTVVRVLPAPRPAPVPVSAAPAAAPRPVIEPLAPQQYRYQVTIDAATRDLLSRAKELCGAADADLLRNAMALLVADLEKKKAATTDRPRPAESHPDSRHIPAAVRREVWARDQGQCAYRAKDGTRCASHHRVEFHHVKPYAAGGPPTAQNIELRCRPHNVYEARVFFAASRLGPDRVPTDRSSRTARCAPAPA